MEYRVLPNFFIVGTVKAGTTSLYNYMKQHPDVYMSPIKEPHYFSKDIRCKDFNKDYREHFCFDMKKYLSKSKLQERHQTFIEEWNDYIELYREVKNEKIIGESSVGYLYSRVAAKGIRDTIPHAKIVVILRDPIERAFSHFVGDFKNGVLESSDFIKEVKKDHGSIDKGWGKTHLYIEIGLYYEQVKRYINIFRRNQVNVYLFDDFKNNPDGVLNDLFKFLNIDTQVKINSIKIYNKATSPRFRKFDKMLNYIGTRRNLSKFLPDNLKEKLKKTYFNDKNKVVITQEYRKCLLPYFEQDIDKLAKLIDRDLSHWKKH